MRRIDLAISLWSLLTLTHGVLVQADPEQQQHADLVKRCNSYKYQPLYARIDGDLRHWSPPHEGITQQLMDQALATRTCNRRGQKAIGVLFEGGKPYLLSNVSNLPHLGHHAHLLTAHLLFFEALGRALPVPDVEFIIGTFDVPEVRLDKVPKGQLPAPILRFCTSPFHADIAVPDIHFQMRAFNKSLLSRIDHINAKYPWAKRTPTLFGRFTGYKRIINRALPSLFRHPANGSDTICRVADDDILFCDARVHFMAWAQRMRRSGLPIDAARQPRIDMLDHARYKYLLHLDGQSCSSRLEQLLLMGSVVFKEESGYYAFYHHLLRPNEHYLPVWKETPEDVVQALEWAQANDVKARQMAHAAQQLAAEFLEPHALTCYWYTMLGRLAALLHFKPGRQHRQYQFAVPVSEFLEGPGKKWIAKHGLANMELP